MPLKNRKYCLLIMILLLSYQSPAQNKPPGYIEYPLISIPLSLEGYQDLKAIQDLIDKEQKLQSTISDRSYALEYLEKEKVKLPVVQYFGIMRLDDGSLSAIPCDSGYYDSVRIAYSMLLDTMGSELAVDHAHNPVNDSIDLPQADSNLIKEKYFYRTDSLYLVVFIRDTNTRDLILGSYFDTLILHSPEGLVYHVEVPAETEKLDTFIQVKVIADRTLDSLLNPPELTVNTPVGNSETVPASFSPVPDPYKVDNSFIDALKNLEGPAVFYVAQKDTFALHQLKEYLDQLGADQDIIGICTGRNDNKIYRNLTKELESRQVVEANLFLVCVETDTRFEQHDSLLLPLENGKSLGIYIDVPKDKLQDYATQNILRESEDLLMSKSYREGIDLLNSNRLLFVEAGIEPSRLDREASLFFEGFFQELADRSALTYKSLVGFEEQWTGPVPKEYTQNARKEAYDKEYAAAFNPDNGQELIDYFKKWDHRIPESRLFGTQPRKLAYSRFLVNKSRNWQEACRQLALAKEKGYKTSSADYSFCRNKEIIQKRSLMATAFNGGEYGKAYQLGMGEKTIYEKSPEHRLMFAESARKTGNFKDAYRHYLWFDSNWKENPEAEMDYDTYQDLIGELAFITGDFQRAFQIFERNYMNSGERTDLYKVLNTKRTVYVNLILTLCIQIKNTTDASLLPNFNRYKPLYMEQFHEIPAGQDAGNTYPKALKTYPSHFYSPDDQKVRSIGRLSDGSKIEFTQRSSLYDGESKVLVNKLLQSGYDGNSLTRLTRKEKETSLEFLGKVFKSLISELKSHSGAGFESALKKLLNSSTIYSYAEYSTEGEIKNLGECPPMDAYKDASYLNIYPRIIDFENTTVNHKGVSYDEFVVPLRENGRKIGYIRIGLKTGEL